MPSKYPQGKGKENKIKAIFQNDICKFLEKRISVSLSQQNGWLTKKPPITEQQNQRLKGWTPKRTRRKTKAKQQRSKEFLKGISQILRHGIWSKFNGAKITSNSSANTN